jgi:hypothetical protein
VLLAGLARFDSVRAIARARQWYETLGGLRRSRTGEEEPHPFKEGWRIRCCYMSAEHEECLWNASSAADFSIFVR